MKFSIKLLVSAMCLGVSMFGYVEPIKKPTKTTKPTTTQSQTSQKPTTQAETASQPARTGSSKNEKHGWW